jgi:hypothetical protein
MFFYTIMNIFLYLLENVNKSSTTAGSLSLTQNWMELLILLPWHKVLAGLLA